MVGFLGMDYGGVFVGQQVFVLFDVEGVLGVGVIGEQVFGMDVQMVVVFIYVVDCQLYVVQVDQLFWFYCCGVVCVIVQCIVYGYCLCVVFGQVYGMQVFGVM